MENERFKPKFDILYYSVLIFASIILIGVSLIGVIFDGALSVLFVTVPTTLLIGYFMLTTVFGYVELREKCVFVKFGFFASREIPYSKIRGTVIERKLYSDSMMSLKNSIEHLNIKHGTFDVTTVSVVDNAALAQKIEERKQREIASQTKEI